MRSRTYAAVSQDNNTGSQLLHKPGILGNTNSRRFFPPYGSSENISRLQKTQQIGHAQTNICLSLVFIAGCGG